MERMMDACSRRQVLRLGAGLLPLLGLTVRGAAAATVKRTLPPVDLDFLNAVVDFQPRDAWAADAPRPWRLRGIDYLDRMTVHHAGSVMATDATRERVQDRLLGIQADHGNRGYGDIAYHFMIDFSGRVWEGRSLAYEGAHTAGQNAHNIGVMLLGNFEEQSPTTPQFQALKNLTRTLRDRYRIKPHRIYGHRDLAQSLCPGLRLYREIVRLREGKT